MWFKKSWQLLWSDGFFLDLKLNVETNDVAIIDTRELDKTTRGTGWHTKES
jgi:hypothetical protein